MPRFSRRKGASGAAIAAIVIVFVIIGSLVFLAPGLFGGLSFGGGGTSFTGVAGPGSQGLVIKSFTKDVVNAEKDIPVLFSLEIENRGEKAATNVRATLFGLPTDTREWTFQPSEREFKFTSATFDGIAIDGSIQGYELSTIEATPKATRSTDTIYTVGTRVTYKYTTVFEGSVDVASRDYVKSITASGTTQSGVRLTSSKSTLGPLTITARTTATNLADGTTEIKVIFDIINTGGGRVFDLSATAPLTSNLDKIRVANGPNTNCPVTETRLINAQSRTITCTVRVSVTSEGYIPHSFGITATYSYFVDATVPLILLKSQQ
jgi:hypothetical protein